MLWVQVVYDLWMKKVFAIFRFSDWRKFDCKPIEVLRKGIQPITIIVVNGFVAFTSGKIARTSLHINSRSIHVTLEGSEINDVLFHVVDARDHVRIFHHLADRVLYFVQLIRDVVHIIMDPKTVGICHVNDLKFDLLQKY